MQEEKAAAEYLAAHVYPTLEPVVLRLMCSLFFPQRFVSFSLHLRVRPFVSDCAVAVFSCGERGAQQGPGWCQESIAGATISSVL